MRKVNVTLLAVILGFTSFAAHAADPATDPTGGQTAPAVSSEFTDAQRAQIENIIKDYLTTKHPEVMAEGLQTLQRREQDSADAKTKQEVTTAKDRLVNDPKTPVGGNPKGTVTIVEFFDYQCGYCKMSEDSVERLLKEDKTIRFVYKDFPILGPASTEAAKAALASVKQGKFQAYHDALMSKKDHLSSDLIYQVAKDVGLDTDALKKDMADPAIGDEITANLKLGQDIGVRGTPMFIIGDNVYPGALEYDQLKQAVKDAKNPDKKS